MEKAKFVFDEESYSESLKEFKNIIKYLENKYQFFSYRGPPRSMRNLELSIVYWLIKTYKPTAFFESGIWWGRCTYPTIEGIRRLGINIPYHIASTYKCEQIDILQKEYDNLVVHYAPGQTAAKQVENEERLGILIDGPKWRHTTRMHKMYRRLEKSSKLIFAYHHDVSKDHKLDYPYFEKYYKENREKFLRWRPQKYVSPESRYFIDGNKKENIMGAALIARDIL